MPNSLAALAARAALCASHLAWGHCSVNWFCGHVPLNAHKLFSHLFMQFYRDNSICATCDTPPAPCLAAAVTVAILHMASIIYGSIGSGWPNHNEVRPIHNVLISALDIRDVS